MRNSHISERMSHCPWFSFCSMKQSVRGTFVFLSPWTEFMRWQLCDACLFIDIDGWGGEGACACHVICWRSENSLELVLEIQVVKVGSSAPT